MLIFLLVALVSFPAEARWVKFETFRLQPVDEAERDSSFLQYRYKLSRALETRDLKALLPLLADDVQTKLEHRGSIAEFIKDWKLEGLGMRESGIWDKLRDTVRLGGSFDRGEFHAPYVFSRWPARFPHMDFYAVLSKNTPVYTKADENAHVIDTLTQEIVGRYDDVPNGSGWKAVRTSSGRTGFIASEHARSPLDYHAIFRKVNGSWKLSLFSVGDWEAHERFE